MLNKIFKDQDSSRFTGGQDNVEYGIFVSAATSSCLLFNCVNQRSNIFIKTQKRNILLINVSIS